MAFFFIDACQSLLENLRTIVLEQSLLGLGLLFLWQ
jgi:hypothetical protein